MSPVFRTCLPLHVPHKDWADDPREENNYFAIERWANTYRNCFPAYPNMFTPTYCLLRVPYRDWALVPEERENYAEIENWSRRLLLNHARQTETIHLHIPHKEWSGNDLERQNYHEIERWARDFQLFCVTTGC